MTLPSEPGPDFEPDPDQILEVAIEVSKVLQRYNVGGVVTIAGMQGAAWHLEIPHWSGVQVEHVGKEATQFRIRMNSRTPEAQRQANATMALLANIRDMSNDVADLFAKQLKHVRRALEAQGAEIIRNERPVIFKRSVNDKKN